MTSPQWPAPPSPERRRLLKTGSLVLLIGAHQIAHGAGIVAVRIWPAEDYSRVTIESDRPLQTTHTMVVSPPRLAVDIEGLQLHVQVGRGQQGRGVLGPFGQLQAGRGKRIAQAGVFPLARVGKAIEVEVRDG